MIDSLFDKSTSKKFDGLAKKQAEIDEKKRDLVKETMRKLDSETIINILDIVKSGGHPNEKNRSEEIGKKYFSGAEMEFNDLMDLNNLYKSNYKKFLEKGVNNG